MTINITPARAEEAERKRECGGQDDAAPTPTEDEEEQEEEEEAEEEAAPEEEEGEEQAEAERRREREKTEDNMTSHPLRRRTRQRSYWRRAHRPRP